MAPVHVDRKTLTQAQAGDTRAQEALLHELGPVLASLVYRLGARREAEDQLQAILAHLLAVLPRFDPEGPAQLSTWAFSVAQRWLLMEKRRVMPALVPIDGGLQVPSPERGVHEHAEDAQLMALVRAELIRLPPEQRRVFELTQLAGQSITELALLDGVPVATLKTRLHRARAQLVARLGPLLGRASRPGGPRAASR